MIYLWQFISLVCMCFIHLPLASNVIVLTSDTFEAQTQASSGATTGDWLVEFYAPWCGHCQKLTPIFEKVATELKGEVNVAKVDVTENGQLGKRFQIRGFPTLLLLSHGKVYKYGGKRTVLDLLNFVRGGYQSMEGEIIAPAPSVWTIMMEHAVDLQKDLITLLETKKNVLLVTFSSGLVLGTVLGCLCGCCTRRGTKSAKVKSE